MRFTSLRKFTFSLALASLVSTGAASAQSLVGVNTTLDHTLDSKSAAIGQVVTAKLNDAVKTADGITLPRGTELIGKVSEVKAGQQGGVSVSVVFSSAKLKDGKEIPVKATVLAAYPESVLDGTSVTADTIGPAPTQVNADSEFNQLAGSLRNIAMNSAVKSSDSGTFLSGGNFKLVAGTVLQVGIAPSAAASGTNAAE